VGGLLTLGYCYRSGDCSTLSTQSQDNGNVLQQTIQRGATTWTQDYTYDTLNRLGGAGTLGVQENRAPLQTYGYDGNGNWYLNSYNSAVLPSPSVETPQGSSWFLANNQINSWAYDTAGNVTGIPALGGSTVRAACAANTMVGVATLRTSCYDAENRMTSETDPNGVTTTYVYDGDGRRVSKNVNGTATTFVSDAMGNLIAEYGGPQNPDSGTLYVSVDHLGSTRLLADGSGNQKYCNDYLPFGGDIFAGSNGRPTCYPSAPTSGIKFTGQYRDYESGLDFFGARHFSGGQGRFTSPDEPFNDQDASDPQSWNLFSYGRNNPLRYVDPSGTTACDENGNNCHDDTTVVGELQTISLVDAMILKNLFFAANTLVVTNVVRQANEFQQMAQPAIDWLGRRNCGGMVAAGMGAGSTLGTGAGALAGPGGIITIPGGFLGGGALGGLGGLGACMSGLRPGGGSAGNPETEYTDTTRRGAVRNIKTNVTPAEFGKNLEANGFAKKTNGSITSYVKGNVQYDVYPVRSSSLTGAPGAQMKVDGEVVLKISLQR
jgi:RHS repeat-associated protein